MYCSLCMMNKFNVNNNILTMLYNSVICWVWLYNLVSWGGNARPIDTDRIDGMIRHASRVKASQLWPCPTSGLMGSNLTKFYMMTTTHFVCI